MLRLSSAPLRVSKTPQAPASSSKVPRFALFFAGLLSACATQKDLAVGGSAEVSAQGREDTDAGAFEEQDSGSENEKSDTADTDTADTDGAGDTQDTEEPYDPESIVDVIGTWPTETTASESIEFGGDLREAYPSFEPSGLAHDELESQFYIAGDDGDFVILEEDGSVFSYWDSGTGGALDSEGVAVDPATGLVYLGDEATSSVLEFDPDAESLTGESCTFGDLATDVPGGLGMEGLAFVPAEYAPSTWPVDSMGYFIAGSQYVSGVNVYPASECVGGGELTSFATLPSSNTDVSGVTFNEDTRRLYVLHDYSNTLDLMKLDGTVVATYTLPDLDSSVDEQQEGVWVNATDCASGVGELVIAIDNTSGYTNNAIVTYQDFFITCR